MWTTRRLFGIDPSRRWTDRPVVKHHYLRYYVCKYGRSNSTGHVVNGVIERDVGSRYKLLIVHLKSETTAVNGVNKTSLTPYRVISITNWKNRNERCLSRRMRRSAWSFERLLKVNDSRHREQPVVEGRKTWVSRHKSTRTVWGLCRQLWAYCQYVCN